MKKAHPTIVSLLFIVILCLQVEILLSEPRAQEVEIKCGKVRVDNPAVFSQNFIRVMNGINEKLRTDGFGTIQVGTGPNTNYGLGQCYSDLNLLDCVLCYGEARGRLPSCFTYNSGHVYLDGCYIRFANYSFYDEISGPGDKTVCGNTTRKSTEFQASARRAVLDAVRDAPFNGGFARPIVQLPRSMNDSAYVLANCWRTLDASSCKACLDNASASVMKCLPRSEGRVLNTGCFLRYSDTEFLNAVPTTGGSKGKKTELNIAVVLTSVGFTVFGAFVGLTIYRKRIIRKNRRGPEDIPIVKLTKILKPTGYFDDANKLGQGGFGAVYKTSHSMKKAHPSVVSLLFIVILCLQVEILLSEPRAQEVEFKCGKVRVDNPSVFSQNFIRVMEGISEKMRTDGFGTIQAGTGPNTNYGLGQCYGDLNLLDCELCYGEARGRLPSCFTYNSGHVYLDGCYIRFANYSFYDEISGPGDKTVCGNETRKSTMFQVSARRALLDAVRDAPFNGGFARPIVQLPRSMNDSAYVLANCWRTLDASSCKACLDNASASVMKCLPWSEGRVLNTGCFLRYSDRDFLNAVPSSGGSKVSKGVIIAIVLSSVGFTVFGAFVGLTIYRKRIIQKKRRGPKDIRLVKLAKILKDSRLTFKYSTLQKATGYFDEANKLGQGGFGAVYKGVLADGREIAVKRLFVNHRCRAVDFFNEVNLISSVKHKNLVKLLGCCLFGPESILVYEFIPNMSLDGFLFNPELGKSLNWHKRSDIVVGIAEGLAYLHENQKFRIIHRDIKSGNILLDQNLRPKIADFGLARTFEDDKSHISTGIAGTLGYMAPEYFAYGKLTEKADVYSFGVLLLEIVTGRRNNENMNDDFCESLITSVWKHFQEGTSEKMFDPNLQLQNYSDSCHMKNEILRVLHVGLLCTQAPPHLRPFMSTIVQMLLRKDEELPAPTNPPFLDEETMELINVPSVGTMSHSSFYSM